MLLTRFLLFFELPEGPVTNTIGMTHDYFALEKTRKASGNEPKNQETAKNSGGENRVLVNATFSHLATVVCTDCL